MCRGHLFYCHCGEPAENDPTQDRGETLSEQGDRTQGPGPGHALVGFCPGSLLLEAFLSPSLSSFLPSYLGDF